MPIYNGNSIEEAIDNGLDDLKLSSNDVTITILTDVLENDSGEVIRKAEVEVKKKESKHTRYAKYGLAFGTGFLAHRSLSNKNSRSNGRGSLALFALCILILFSVAFVSEDGNNPQLQVPGSSEQFKSVHFSIVAQQFEDAGFSNIELTPIEDLRFAILTKDGAVEKVTIVGNEEFDTYKRYDQDVPVNIYYHTFKPEK